jgi:SAM-dependent methyltransferase
VSGFASVYDKVMAYADYNSWYEFIKKIIEEKGIRGKDVLDLGCGTGEISIRFKKEGYSVLGVDISTEMLSIAADKARNKKLDIHFANQDMRELKFPVGFDIVVSLFDTINYLISIEEVEECFKSVAEHLDDNGIFVFDMVTKNMLNTMFPGGTFVDDREDMTLVWTREHDEESGLEDISTTFFVKEKSGKYTRFDDEYSKKVFSIEEIKECSKRAGFNSFEYIVNSELAGERIFCILKKKGD